MKATDVLGKVFHLFDDKTRWTTGTVARDSRGEPTGVVDKDAAQWCALGAIARVVGEDRKSYERAVWALACELRPKQFQGELPANEDQLGTAEVVVYKTNDLTDGTGYVRIRGGIQRVLAQTETPAVAPVEEREPALV